jgi:uncharacterized protein (DUF1800 family)
MPNLLAFVVLCAVPGVEWNARNAEHLLNRAGFGARPNEIEAAVALGQEALVDRLLNERAEVEPPFIEPIEEPLPRALKELSEDEQKKVKRDVADRDRRQQVEYTAWWVDRMAKGDDPLLDRMTLFWHGLMTSSIEQVRRSYPMLRQSQFLRQNALGSYSDLLYGIAKDPAMLLYLNNTSNRKGNPNENLARELMELFSLGVGNYTQKDVKEAARALTGRATTRDGEYVFRPNQHDAGEKTILGVKGKHDGDALVKIILAQDACPRYVARRIITYLEGVPPEAARLEEYAQFLRANEFQLKPFLKKLFLDPAFYRDEVVGARVQSPVDYLVGAARRLGTDAPPVMLGSGAALLGQRLLAPPNVKGWDEGPTWISTSTLMQRGNLAGLMLGIVRIDDVLSQADLLAKGAEAPAQDGTMPDAGAPMTREQMGEMEKRLLKSGKKGGFAYESLRRTQDAGWAPTLNFTARMKRQAAATDEAIVDRMLDELLAIRAPEDTREKMRTFLTDERVQLSVRDGHLLEAGPAAERVLRRLAHLILSLPEAQLM